jgi:hypothetical protein
MRIKFNFRVRRVQYFKREQLGESQSHIRVVFVAVLLQEQTSVVHGWFDNSESLPDVEKC